MRVRKSHNVRALLMLWWVLVFGSAAWADPPKGLPGDPVDLPAFCSQQDSDRDPAWWIWNIDRRKREYQFATISERFMGNTELELMQSLAPFDANAEFRKPGPEDHDDTARLIGRLSLSLARFAGFPTKAKIWPWGIGWNTDKLSKWRAAHPTDDPIKSWWRKQIGPELEELHNDADMQANQRIRVLYLLPPPNPDVPPEVRGWIEDSFLKFKYWIDEPRPTGQNNEMTFWSENHQIMFATVEYLAGQYFEPKPDRVFRDLKTGEQHKRKARPRILRWLDERLRFGFSEWHSPIYIAYDIMPLLNLIDFADDDEIKRRATMVLDLLIFDLARYTQNGNYGVTAGRVYPEHKVTGWDQGSGDFIQILFGTRCPPTRFGDRLWSGPTVAASTFASSSNYKIPMALLAIGHDRLMGRDVIDRSRVSINFDEAEDYGIAFDTLEDGMFWWGKNAYATKYTIKTSLAMIKAYGMAGSLTQGAVKDLFGEDGGAKKVIGGLLSRVAGSEVNAAVNMIPPGVPIDKIVDSLSSITEGMALTRANIYTYRNEDVMLSSVQNWRKGQMGPQVQSWQATFDSDVVVFTTYPAPSDSHNGPNWWGGNASNPRIVQHEDAAIIAYAPEPISFQKFFPVTAFGGRTHAWFPWKPHYWLVRDERGLFKRNQYGTPFPQTFFESSYFELAGPGQFDHVCPMPPGKPDNPPCPAGQKYNGWYFGRKGTGANEGYIGLYSAQPCEWTQTGDWEGKEIACNGLRNVFIVQIGNRKLGKFRDFYDFIAKVAAAEIKVSKGVREPVLGLLQVEASYKMPNGKTLELNYDKQSPRLNGQPYCDDDFPRYENPYVAGNPGRKVEWGQRKYTIQHGGFFLTHDLDAGTRATVPQ